MMRVLLLALSLVVSGASIGCHGRSAVDTQLVDQGPPRQFIVLMDLSLSRSADMKEDGDQFLAKLASSLRFGDHVTLMQVQQVGLQDHPKRWSDDMPVPSDPTFPTSRDRKALAAEQGTVEFAVKAMSVSSAGSKFLHTDLFTTLYLAGETAHDYRSRPTTIVLLSDMLQSANGIEMDQVQRMPAGGWIQRQAQLGLLPRLNGACVMVVGADGTTKEGAKVRDFWQDYFTATGAKLLAENYRASPPNTGDVKCG